MRLGSRLRRSLAAVALALVAAGCGDDETGPSCAPLLTDEIRLGFPIYAPGAALPFAEARLRQAYFDYEDARCPAPFARTYLSFVPLAPLAAEFGYTLEFLETGHSWFYSDAALLTGDPVATPEVLVSYETYPIDQGTLELTFDYFTPL